MDFLCLQYAGPAEDADHNVSAVNGAAADFWFHDDECDPVRVIGGDVTAELAVGPWAFCIFFVFLGKGTFTFDSSLITVIITKMKIYVLIKCISASFDEFSFLK